jgi:exodeoxyribonuclease VII large subunit
VQPELFRPSSLTVSALTAYLRELLESDPVLVDLWVEGEISNLSRPSSGHIYFTLKDASASLRCVIWRSQAIRLQGSLENGQAVAAHGHISLYERDGTYQLYIDQLRPVGEGWLFQEFMRLKAQLESEGLFDPDRKRPLPVMPRRIGIVTSPTGAALQDMLNTLSRRYPLAEVILAPCAVQGEEAPPQILAALAGLNQLTPPPDVILMARGGGSLEDLWAFNDERVVRAVAASVVPVVTGVGHETDFTLSDFAADLRAPTPTAAAEIATPDVADLSASLNALYARLRLAGQNTFGSRKMDFNLLQARLGRVSPGRRIQNDRQRLDELDFHLIRGLLNQTALLRARLLGISHRLEALNPQAVLERGFAVVRDARGGILRSTEPLQPGAPVQVQLARGGFSARVESLQPDENLSGGKDA